MREWYVYELIDPRVNQVFYVGKGLGRRMYAHEKEARKGVVSPKCDRIRGIIQAGYEIELRQVAFFRDETKAYAHERELIAQHAGNGLTNRTIGGVGGLSKVLVEEPFDLRAWRIRFHSLQTTRKSIEKLREWLWRVEGWRQNPRFLSLTFPGLRNGDELAEEGWKAIRRMVAEHDSLVDGLPC